MKYYLGFGNILFLNEVLSKNFKLKPKNILIFRQTHLQVDSLLH